MSLASVHLPVHTFTSTMTDHRGKIPSHPNFNYYIIILTAILFFTVLAWFNFALAFYGTIISTDPDHKDETISTLGFAVFWTLIAVAIYYTMDYYEVLGSNESSDHPLLREESKGSIDGSDYIGRVDIGTV